MRWRSDDAAQRPEQQTEASMKIGPVEVHTVDECLTIVEAAFRSPMWKELPQEEKTRLIGRLSDVEITEKQELEE
jgi:hypothetical protein